MSLPRPDLFTGLIVLISPYERSADPIQRTFEVNLQATKPITLVEGKEYF